MTEPKRVTLISTAAAAALLGLVACDQTADAPAAAPEASAAADGAPTAPPPRAAAEAAGDVEPGAAFDAIVDSITADLFKESPELSTSLGIPEDMVGGPYNGRLSDYGLTGRARARELFHDGAARLAAVDPATLDDERRMTRAVLLELLAAGEAADVAAGGWGSPGGVGFTVYPVTQLSGPHIDLPQLLASMQPVASGQDAADYVSRLEGFGAAFDQTIEAIRADAAAGVIPPDFVIDKTLAVIANFKAPAVKENILYTSLDMKLADAGVEGAEGYLAQAEAAIGGVVYPAYDRLAAVLAELRPQAVHHAGIDRLPNGPAVYQAMVRIGADSPIPADEIHEIGLAEVARITAEMDAILKAQGRSEGSVGERMDALQRDPQFLYPNTDEGKEKLIADVNGLVAEVQALAPQWFATIPPQAVEVQRVPVFSEASAPGGYYNWPSLDGSRPGIYWINLRDTANNPSFGLPTLTYHEGVPGHHYQIALSLSLEGIPLLRKLAGTTTAYAEGWGLYAERVAKEMGLYEDDPYGDLGRLQSELFRAVRLVVDTGLHAKGWSREQAIAYMVDAGAATPGDAEVEIERYSVWPGQALGYKMGMLKILELRARAEAELGDTFDVREFHDAVLRDGGLPMGVLETRVEEWIAAEKAS